MAVASVYMRRQSFASRVWRAARRFACVWLCVVFMSPVTIAEVGVEPLTNATFDRTPTSNVQHQWGAITLFHGLPSNSVRAVAQDADGIIWIGTDAGLARFDAHQVETVMMNDEARGRGVSALHVDGRGVLWVGTDAGAMRRTGEGWQFIEETRGASVTAIASSPVTERVMLATRGALFECRVMDETAMNGKGFAVTKIEDKLLRQTASDDAPQTAAPLEITSLVYDGDRVFIGTRGRGILLFEDGIMRERLVRPRPFFVEAITKYNHANNDAALWFGAQAASEASGLYVATVGQGTTHIANIDTGNITALGFDAGGALWIGTNERGVMLRHQDGEVRRWTFESTGGGLVSNQINCLFVDREGVVWFGTNRGVCRYDGGAAQVEIIAPDSESNFIRTLYRTQDSTLWCGTQSGLFRFDEIQGRWFPVGDLAGRIVHAISEDTAGNLIVGTASGLYVGRADVNAAPAKDTNDTNKPDGTSVRAVAVWRGQTYLAVFGRGVERLNVTRDTRQRAPLIADAPMDVMEALREPVSLYADEKHLWIGTTRGAFMFDGERVTAVDALAPLRDAGVWDIAGSERSGLWFATSKGLYLWRDGELTAQFEGSVRSVRVITDDDDARQVWCAIDGGGVVTLRISDDFGIIKSAFNVEQGLPTQNAFTVLPLPANGAGGHTILIGTNQGLVRYRTSRIAPQPAWTRAGARPMFATTNMLPPLRLAYPQRDVHVEVAGISSRTFPQKYQYGFILRDAKNLILKRQLTSNSAFITTDLAPGDYQLTAHVFGIDLTRSHALAFNFTVETAPFPKTTLALSVLLALALGTLWWGARQNRRLRQAGGELFRVNRELTGARLALANEAESERRRIARDLHDQTLADLRRLLLRCDAGNNHAPEANSLRHDIEAVSIEVRRICEDLSPSVLENVGLAAALEWGLTEACAQLPASERFRHEFVCDENLDERLRLPVSVQIQLYRIVQEALNNISRHAGASFVKLIVTLAPDGALHLTLENDGTSFNPANVKRGRGIVNMHARASLIAAHLEWTTREDGDGTRLTLRLPIAECGVRSVE